MKLIPQSAELIRQEPGYNGLLRHIERCGRVCYKSEDKITPDSAQRFVEALIKNGHTSVLEHGECMVGWERIRAMDAWNYGRNWVNRNGVTMCLTNYRVFANNFGPRAAQVSPTLDYDGVPKKYRRVTFHLVDERAIIDELVRHRVGSYSIESTRYCNYSKDKFGGQLTFIRPVDWEDMCDKVSEAEMLADFKWCEERYLSYVSRGLTPQQARRFLVLDIKSEAYMTAFVDDWINIIRLRTSPAAHEQIRSLMGMVRDQLIEAGYITSADI